MGHHYLHINPDVKNHLANQLPSEGWAELIVSDLTENGTQLSAVVLPTNEHGPQVALYGDRFYGRASTDKFRTDALWVYRVEAGRNPNQVPVKIGGRFEALVAGRHYPPRDAVTPIFGLAVESAADVEPERVLRLKPSPRLAKILASMPASARAGWRPSAERLAQSIRLSFPLADADAALALRFRQSIQQWLKAFKIPDPAARTVRTSDFESFGRVAEHLKAKLTDGVAILVGRRNRLRCLRFVEQIVQHQPNRCEDVCNGVTSVTIVIPAGNRTRVTLGVSSTEHSGLTALDPFNRCHSSSAIYDSHSQQFLCLVSNQFLFTSSSRARFARGIPYLQ